jgi:hypothetical protein
MSFPALAADAPPPRWDITEACANKADSDRCPRVESDTRRTLLDRWTALPIDIRVTCSKEVESEGQRSYRKLAACIDDLAFKAFDEQRRSDAAPVVTSH